MIQDKTKRMNEKLAIPSAPLYLDIFPTSRNTSLASWSARTTEPTREKLSHPHPPKKRRRRSKQWGAKGSHCRLGVWWRKHIPTYVWEDNKNKSSDMMTHWNSKIRTSCFPEDESKDWVCIESSHKHIQKLQL